MSELVKEMLSVADALDYAPGGEISHAEIVVRAACLSIETMQKQIAELLKMQEALIEWIQEDCPYNREDILEIAERNMKEQGE